MAVIHALHVITGGADRKDHPDSPPCWCKPDVFLVCPDCRGTAPNCLFCAGRGLLWYDCDLPQATVQIVVHRPDEEVPTGVRSLADLPPAIRDMIDGEFADFVKVR